MTTIELFQSAHVSGDNRNIATASIRLAASAVSSIAAMIRRWHRHRRDRAAFMTLLGKDEWVYRDIGVHRGDVEWASRLPMHVNAAKELERLRAFSSMGR